MGVEEMGWQWEMERREVRAEEGREKGGEEKGLGRGVKRRRGEGGKRWERKRWDGRTS